MRFKHIGLFFFYYFFVWCVCVFSSIIYHHNILLCSDFCLCRLMHLSFSLPIHSYLWLLFLFIFNPSLEKEGRSNKIRKVNNFSLLFYDCSCCRCCASCSMVILFFFTLFFSFYLLFNTCCSRMRLFVVLRLRLSFSHFAEIISLLLSNKKIKNKKKWLHVLYPMFMLEKPMTRVMRLEESRATSVLQY